MVNAGCRDKDLAHIGNHLQSYKVGGGRQCTSPHTLASPQGKGGDVSMEVHDDRSLLALQGPKAAAVLQTLTGADLSKLLFSHFARIDVGGSPCWVTRTGCVHCQYYAVVCAQSLMVVPRKMSEMTIAL